MNMNNAPDPDDIGKLFVGGLSSQTTKETLHEYFGQFGEVVDSVVMKNIETGRSRGFGFITFKEPNVVFKVLQVRHHEIDGKKVDPKECTPRSLQKGRKQAGKCKIFLGGLPPDVTEESIRHVMSRFGKVDQVVIMQDQETKKCRGFGFLSYELEESIDQACEERFVIINDKQIECKRAEPRANTKNPSQSRGYERNQNGFERQLSFGQNTSTSQNNWNTPSPPAYNVQGNAYGGYQSYGGSSVPYNSSSMTYTTPPPMQYAQPYQQSYASPMGNYNYSPVPANTYAQPVFGTDAQPSDVAVTAVPEAGKPYGSNDYSQSSSYGPVKSFSGVNPADVTYQSVSPSANYQRFHPYKA